MVDAQMVDAPGNFKNINYHMSTVFGATEDIKVAFHKCRGGEVNTKGRSIFSGKYPF